MATKTKQQDLNSLSVEDLNTQIADADLQMRKLIYAHAITPIENPMQIRNLRKQIARLKTALRSKQLGLA